MVVDLSGFSRICIEVDTQALVILSPGGHKNISIRESTKISALRIGSKKSLKSVLRVVTG